MIDWQTSLHSVSPAAQVALQFVTQGVTQLVTLAHRSLQSVLHCALQIWLAALQVLMQVE